MPEKILHMSLTRSIGGIASFQKNLLSHIDRDKYDFEFITTFPNAMIIPFLEENGAKVHYLPSHKRLLSYCIKLYKIIKNGNYKAIHIHKNSCANPIPFIICRLAKAKKVIAHSHNTSSINGGFVNMLHYIFRPIVVKWSDVKIACSPEAGKWLFGNKFNDFEIVKNGIEVSKFKYDIARRDDMRKKLNLEDKLIIGHVGNYIPQKNHRFMVDIIKEAVKLLPCAHLLFVGRGDAMPEIQEYADSQGVLQNIGFLGSRNDVADLYQAMDIFLFPSLHEGLPIAGIEAQTAGLACLFSDVISNTIVLTDTVTQMSLNCSAKEWAEKIISIHNNFNREDTSEIIVDAGYDSIQLANKMQQIYQ